MLVSCCAEKMKETIYKFEGFLLDISQKSLKKNGLNIAVQPKAYELLKILIERQGRIVSRGELIDAIWGNTFVEESNLRFCVHSLRKILGKKADENDFIETVPKRGYRFTADVTELCIDPAAEPFEVPGNGDTSDRVPKRKFLSVKWLATGTILATACFLTIAIFRQQPSQPLDKYGLGIDTLAVLPFVQIGEGTETGEALQMGLADALHTSLIRIKHLRLLPVGAIRKYAGTDFDSLQTGRELNVDAVLDGSFRYDHEDVRVTVRLMRVSNGETLLSETFTTQKLNNLEVEELVSLRTARLLWLKLAQTTDEKSLAEVNVNSEAKNNYLAGRKIWQNRELKQSAEMIRHFEKAVEVEPDWSLAHSGLAEAVLNIDTLLTDWDTAENSVRKAVELDDENAQAYAALGQILHRKYWDWEGAEVAFKKALKLDPDYAHAHHEYGVFLSIQRRLVEAEVEIRKAVETEPFSPFYYASLCELYSYDRRFQEALKQCSFAQHIEPDFWRTRKQLFWIYVQKEMYSEMSAMILGKLSANEKAKHPLTAAFAKNDLRSFWASLIDERLRSKSNISNSLALATFYLQIGENEKAMDHLERSYNNREIFFPTANADSVFDSIRAEKRFRNLMKKVGLQK